MPRRRDGNEVYTDLSYIAPSTLKYILAHIDSHTTLGKSIINNQSREHSEVSYPSMYGIKLHFLAKSTRPLSPWLKLAADVRSVKSVSRCCTLYYYFICKLYSQTSFRKIWILTNILSKLNSVKNHYSRV